MKHISLETAVDLDEELFRIGQGAGSDPADTTEAVEQLRVRLRSILADAIENSRLLALSRSALDEALTFVRCHSEDWYTPGQELIRKCEALLAEISTS